MSILTENFWWKLLSLLAACAVWYSMANQPDSVNVSGSLVPENGLVMVSFLV